jgi:hypothetical protein
MVIAVKYDFVCQFHFLIFDVAFKDQNP